MHIAYPRNADSPVLVAQLNPIKYEVYPMLGPMVVDGMFRPIIQFECCSSSEWHPVHVGRVLSDREVHLGADFPDR